MFLMPRESRKRFCALGRFRLVNSSSASGGTNTPVLPRRFQVRRLTARDASGVRFRHFASGRCAAHLHATDGVAHSDGRQECRGCLRAQRRGVLSFSRTIAGSRDIQSRTSDRRQPIPRPRNLSFFGNRPIRHRPVNTQSGRRVRRATSCALRSSIQGGNFSFTQREIDSFPRQTLFEATL